MHPASPRRRLERYQQGTRIPVGNCRCKQAPTTISFSTAGRLQASSYGFDDGFSVAAGERSKLPAKPGNSTGLSQPSWLTAETPK